MRAALEMVPAESGSDEAWESTPESGRERVLLINTDSPEIRSAHEDDIKPSMLSKLEGSLLPVQETRILGKRPVYAVVAIADIPEVLIGKEGVNGELEEWRQIAIENPVPDLSEEEQRLNRGENRDGTGLIFFVVRNSGALRDVEVQPVPEE